MSPQDKWREFFRNADQAPLIAAGQRLVTTFDDLGYGYIVSTTRPFWTRRRTERWLRRQALPAPIGLYTRRRDHHPLAVSAVGEKADHFSRSRFIPKLDVTTILYIDDEPQNVDQLRAAGVPAVLLDDLAAENPDDLAGLLERYRHTSRRVRA